MESDKPSEDGKLESASFSSQTVDPEEERKLVRKLDGRIMPITCLLYLFACRPFCYSKALMQIYLTHRPRPFKSRKRAAPRASERHTRRRPHRKTLRLGQLRLLFCICMLSVDEPRTFNSHSYKILCQVPASVTSKLFPPRVWLACMAFGWGISSTLMVSGGAFSARQC